MKTTTKLWIIIAALAIASPIGLYLPQKLNAGSAWGEWGADEMKGLVGYVPHGLQKLSSAWKAILPDYSIKGWESKGLGHLSFAYIVSAIIGIGVCVGVGVLLGRLLAKKDKPENGKK